MSRLRFEHGDPKERYRAHADALRECSLPASCLCRTDSASQIPEVKAVEQIISDEEAIAADEFAKFEARLRAGGKTVEI